MSQPTRFATPVLRATLGLLSLMALIASGCGRSGPMAPSGASATRGTDAPGPGTDASAAAPDRNVSRNRGFYPLAIGNRWHYRGSAHLDLEPGNQTIDLSLDAEIRQIAVESLFGRDYVVEEQTLASSPSEPPSRSWFRSRQDRSGLYTADVPSDQPPRSVGENPATVAATGSRYAFLLARGGEHFRRTLSSARDRAAYLAALDRAVARLERIHSATRTGPGPGTTAALDSEITTLSYPLHRGASWEIRHDPMFGAEVEGRERLQLPAGSFDAFRIRLTNEFMGPDDRVHVWYGRSGYLREVDHVVALVTDPNGNPIGEATIDVLIELDDLNLVDRRGERAGGQVELETELAP